MFKFITGSINHKLILLVIGVTLIPLAMTTFIGIWMFQDALKKQLSGGLDGLRINKSKAIIDHLQQALNDADIAATQTRVIKLLTEPNFDPSQVDASLKALSSKGEHSGIIIYSAEANATVYTLGINKDEVVKAFPNSPLEMLCRQVLKTGKSKFLDYIEYPPVNGPAMFIGAPVVNNGKTAGVLLLLVNIAQMDEIMLDPTGLGKTGESFIIGEDGFLRTSCRKRQSEGIPSVMKVKMKDKLRDDVFKAENGHTDVMINSHDAEALVSKSVMDLRKVSNDLKWAIIAEVETQELNAPIYGIIKNISMASLGLGLIACVIGYLVAISISKPLISFTAKLVKLAVEISAAVSELAANSAETATAIAEISTTMEEVKQTTHIAADKAAHVSETANRVSSISEDGSKATHEAVNGMNHIKDEMMVLAENIVKLSGQTQSIGEIITTVNDLAEQSNLLAVNAAIEAAKAGEFGKGFAVVAQEIKSLAEQSKASTRQVSGILNEIQQATSSAVMATERGSKAVEAGVQLSESAGEAINTLAASISESADATSQITASGKQQIIGIDQLAIALDSIRIATDQSLEGIRQLEHATVSMKELAAKLKSLTEKSETN